MNGQDDTATTSAPVWYRSRRARLLLMWVLLVIWAALNVPHALRAALQYGLERQQYGNVSVEGLAFNPFKGTFGLYGVHAEREGEPVLVIGALDARISWRAVWQRQALMESLVVQGARLRIERLDDNRLRIAGYTPGDEPEPDAEPTAWAFGIAELRLRDSVIDYRTGARLTQLGFDDAHLTRLLSWETEQSASLQLRGRMNEAKVAIDAQLHAFAPDFALSGHLTLGEFDLRPFAPLLAEAFTLDSARLSADTDLQLRIPADGGLDITQDGRITLTDLQGRQATRAIDKADLTWQGKTTWTKAGTAPGELQLAGTLDSAALALRDSDLDYRHSGVQWSGDLRWQQAVDDAPMQLALDGQLVSKAMAVSQGEALRYQHAAIDWRGKLDLQAAADALRIQPRGRLALSEFTFTNPAVSAQGRQADWDGAVDVTPGQITADGALQLVGADADLPQQALRIRNDAMQWQGKATLERATNALTLVGALTVAATRVDDTARQLQLLGLAQLSIPDIDVQGIDAVRAGTVQVRQLALLQSLPPAGAEARAKPDEEALTLLRAERIAVASLDLQQRQRLTIAGADFEQLDARLWREATGGWRLLDRLRGPAAEEAVSASADDARAAESDDAATAAETPAAADTDAESEQTAVAAPFTFRIDNVRIHPGSTLRFVDESVKPTYRAKLDVEELRVQDLDSAAPDQASPVTLRGKLGPYSVLDVQGYIKPFAPRLTLELTGKIEEFDLSALSSYTGRELGYNLKSGQLTADVDIHIIDGVMQGDNQLFFNNLQVGAVNQKKMQEMEAQLAMPLDAALSMLRDKDDNIRFKLPVTGDISDPKFDVSDAINQAIGKALRVAAMGFVKLALQPFGALITIAEMAGKGGGMQLEPVQFAPASEALPDETGEYLDKIAGLLKDRPQLRLSLCGFATATDRAQLASADLQTAQTAEAERAAADSKKKWFGSVEPAEITAADVAPVEDERLLGLARARANAIKDVFIAADIDSGRLFICNPEIDAEADGQPRVELRL